MRYLWLILLLVTSAHATTWFVDFAGGADSNNGTAKGTAFKHAPGMTGCTSTCASTTLAGGDIVTFKGGQSWTSSFPWTLVGGSASMITYTTDHTWFVGGSYTQPVFDDGHADPGATGMIHLNNAGFVTMNDFNLINCGTASTANTDKCLVWENTHDIVITNSVFATQSWIANYFIFDSAGSYSNFTFTGNDFSVTSGAIWFASAQGSTSEHNVNYNNNTFHDFAQQLVGGVHGDGAWHYFGVPATDATQYVDGVTFCDNRFYGDFRAASGGMTAFFFTEGAFSGTLCNNDMSYTPVQANMFDALIDLSGNSNSKLKTVGIYNNSLAAIGTNAMSAAYDLSGMVAGDSITSKNNIIYAPQYAIYLEDAPTAAAFVSDYNLLNSSSSNLDVAGSFKSYAQWQALGYDTHGLLGSNPSWVGAPGNEQLNSVSPTINAGLNLVSLSITILDSDILGITRPVSNAWGMGAFQFVGTYYISPSGNDSNPGTLSSPWLTFTHAIPLLNPGYTLVLETGTYTATNVFPSINCSTTAQNGSAPAPITLIAQSQRKAWIDGDGSAVPFQLQNCSYWTISGLHVSDANNASLSESYTFGVINSSNIKLIYNLVDHTNQLVNEHALGLQGTCNSLVQYNEVYYFHRHAFIDYQNSCTSGNGNEWQQNYSNARGWGSGSTVGNGNGFMAYGSQYSLFENNISENNALGAGMDTEAISGSNNVAHVQFLGVVSLSDNQGMGGAAHQSGTCPNNITYTNDAVVTPVEIGWEPRGVQSLSLTNTSLFPTSGVINNYFQDANNFSGCTPSGTVTNSDILSGNSVTGYNNALDGSCAPGSCTLGTLTLNYDGYFGSGSYSANATVTHQFSTNPALGTCYLWVPLASPAKGAGLSGADIGATVLYAYSGGNPTSTPLWNSSGQLISAGAKVTGLNDQAGSSLFDVGARLHINQGGCSFPAGYLPGPAPTAPNNFSIAKGNLQSSGRIGH